MNTQNINEYTQYLHIQLLFNHISLLFNLTYMHLPFIVRKMDSLIGIDNIKQYYNVSDNEYNYIGILRPELTYLATQKMNLQKDSIYYYGYCFRRERTQYLRYKEFQQIGIEFTSCSLYKHYIDIVLCILHIKCLLSCFNVLYKTIVNIQEDTVCTQIRNIFNTHFSNVEYNTTKRTGGDATYTILSFEIHIYSKQKNMYYETIGGGCYKTSIGYGIGYACGIERLNSLAQLTQNTTYLKTTHNVTVYINIAQDNNDYMNIYNALHTVLKNNDTNMKVICSKHTAFSVNVVHN